MKILRKRVGSLKVEENKLLNLKIDKDSVFIDNEIVFNYLPIKN